MIIISDNEVVRDYFSKKGHTVLRNPRAPEWTPRINHDYKLKHKSEAYGTSRINKQYNLLKPILPELKQWFEELYGS